jgi:putative FmdB family regulatory protein
MPTYDYRCQACTAVYEERRSFSEFAQPSACPQCGSQRVERLFSSVFTFVRDSGIPGFGSSSGGCACSTGGTCACRGV